MGGCTTSRQDCLFLSVYSEEGPILTFCGKVRVGVLTLFHSKYWGFIVLNQGLISFLALIVRYVTGRFVHEYDPTLGKLIQ